MRAPTSSALNTPTAEVEERSMGPTRKGRRAPLSPEALALHGVSGDSGSHLGFNP